jgi:hypothetical protein
MAGSAADQGTQLKRRSAPASVRQRCEVGKLQRCERLQTKGWCRQGGRADPPRGSGIALAGVQLTWHPRSGWLRPVAVRACRARLLQIGRGDLALGPVHSGE